MNYTSNFYLSQLANIFQSGLVPFSANTLTTGTVKAAPGGLFGTVAINPNASTIWLQFFNSVNTPALGSSVVWAVPVPGSGSLVLSPTIVPLALFNVGIGVAVATTSSGTTAPASAPAVTLFYQ